MRTAICTDDHIVCCQVARKLADASVRQKTKKYAPSIRFHYAHIGEGRVMPESADTGVVMQKLLSQAFGGDKDALGRLLELHRGYLRALAQRQLGGGLDARLSPSDVVQQTCLSALRTFPQFQGRQVGEFVVWLQRIHERNVNDAIRQHV